ncbi:DUF882 domain-containing protein [Reyranella sp.]|jgi:uncharacterized protein YcbK (DUF882 family)|uniref:DUF882 domain-containing protein n=1 Tax=Reyranella sp. TaxID=1929291 RepID=UPI000BC6589A|nr:DUF882 domain-containing protein [Reyranella sp.]OYY41632.1 MAG: hypothetical protein B7Y57_13335 [Rhodospirillales bacterium 35-66-84]OYZ93335.1 MAG: hypothetical protein B7Y08_17080 [Rhodospirillales bacterium 24-66-33]OZB24833.1 MAG: hypothetical protein B7X63_14485 [Rhodospirillales bacterium 39-66-50]HQS15638.1 DUF882 domain-containing protein [Reyranella sp.]HQT12904.1 DUF882 domain-containing protein [Reyranella sp.]
MRSFVLSLATLLAFAGTGFAQTNTGASTAPKVKTAATATTKTATTKKKTAAPAKSATVTRAAAQQKKAPPVAQQKLRGSRYGGFAPAAMAAPVPTPDLDLSSPRSLSLVNYNTKEELTVTYWSNGAYHRSALDQLNQFLRDTRTSAATEMDPLLFDVLWHTARISGYGGQVEVLSAFRSPESNAWLASVSRGVARDSQHMNGNAMDIRFPGVPVFRIRQAARSLNMGGVGFYPRSGFVHIDTGPVRYW